MEKRRILIVDDEEDLSFIMAEMLENYNYEVRCVNCPDDAFECMENQTFHLIILDINLPQMTGFELCSEIRKKTQVPVIFASARTSEDDRVTGFDIGGDDYIMKPYSMKELLSRVNAMMRRTYGKSEEEKIYSFGNIEVNVTKRNVSKAGEMVSLSLKEMDLLAYMCEHADVPLSKEKLLSEVWGTFSTVEPATLPVHIRWLREKLEENPSKPEYIKTVYKVGYMLETK